MSGTDKNHVDLRQVWRILGCVRYGALMPAPKRVSDRAVLEAIQRWRGNVSAAADQLKIARVNLRKRLESLGVTPATFRGGAGEGGMSGTHRNVSVPMDSTGTHEVVRNASAGKSSRPRAGGIFSGKGAAAKFSAVQTAEKDVAPAGVPIRTVAARRKPARLDPANEDRLVAFQREVEARYDVDTDTTELLNQFFEEGFEAWAARKLEPEQPEKGRGK